MAEDVISGGGLDYVYEHLPMKHNKHGPQPFTRILHLNKGQLDEPLTCKLVITNVREKAGSYKALSYVWGTPATVAHIICDSKSIGIANNLRDALHRLRRPDGSRRIWIDALCINQRDHIERGQQVQMMRYIYQHASQTIVWLGQDIELQQEFLMARALKGSHGPLFNTALAQQRGGKYKVSRDEERSLCRIMSNAWFYRVWVMQEVSLSKEARAVCGRNNIGEHKVDFFQLLRSARLLLKSGRYAHDENRLTFWAERSERRGTSSNVECSLGPVLSVLSELRNFGATDPRDKLYALLGITDEGISPSVAQGEKMHESFSLDGSQNPYKVFLEGKINEAVTFMAAPAVQEAFNQISKPAPQLNDQHKAELWQALGEFAREDGLPEIFEAMKDHNARTQHPEIKRAIKEDSLDPLSLEVFANSGLTNSIISVTSFSILFGIKPSELHCSELKPPPSELEEACEISEAFLKLLQHVKVGDNANSTPEKVAAALSGLTKSMEKAGLNMETLLPAEDLPDPLSELNIGMLTEDELRRRNRLMRQGLEESMPKLHEQFDSMLQFLKSIAANDPTSPLHADLDFVTDFMTMSRRHYDSVMSKPGQPNPEVLNDLTTVAESFPKPTTDQIDYLKVLSSVDPDFAQLAPTPHYHPALIPDYTRSCCEVYTRLSLYLLQHKSAGMDVLSHVQHRVRPEPSTLSDRWPSWMARWDQPGIPCLLQAAKAIDVPKTNAEIRTHGADIKRVSIRGLQIASIAVVSQPVQMTESLVDDIMAIWLQLHLSPEAHALSIDPLLDLPRTVSLLETLLCVSPCATPRGAHQKIGSRSDRTPQVEIAAIDIVAMASAIHATVRQLPDHTSPVQEQTRLRY